MYSCHCSSYLVGHAPAASSFPARLLLLMLYVQCSCTSAPAHRPAPHAACVLTCCVAAAPKPKEGKAKAEAKPAEPKPEKVKAAKPPKEVCGCKMQASAFRAPGLRMRLCRAAHAQRMPVAC